MFEQPAVNCSMGELGLFGRSKECFKSKDLDYVDLSLPPLVQESIQRAIENGQLFSNSSDFGFFLPPPLGLAHASTSRREFGEAWSSTSSQSSSPTFGHNVFTTDLPSFHTSSDHGRDVASGRGLEWPHSPASKAERVADWVMDPSYHLHDAQTSAAMKRGRKVVLTAEQARDIYRSRPCAHQRPDGTSAPSESSRSRQLAEKYNVSAKTIRDVWNRLTWAESTQALWTNKEVLHYITSHNRAVGGGSSGDEDGAAAAAAAVINGLPVAMLRRRPGRPKGIKDTRPRKVIRFTR